MSFKTKFDSFFTKLFHDAPRWEHFASAAVTFAAPVVMSALAINDPAAMPLVLPIINEVQADLATVGVLTGDGTATPSLSGAVQRVQDNLQAVLDMNHIKDQKAVANVKLVISEFKALATMIPSHDAATQAANGVGNAQEAAQAG